MKTRAFVTLIAAVALLAPLTGKAQDALAQARTLYASADYEQALALLQEAPAGREAHYYRALCLIALGQSDAAADQIAAVVALDPMFVPPSGEVSPRVAATFTETRRRLLPDIARTTFTDGRSKYQAGDRAGARQQFELTLKMLDDSAVGEDDALADLRLVASGFLELVKAEPSANGAPAPAAGGAAESAPVEPVAAAAPPVSSSGPPQPRVATAPVTIAQDLPPWRPSQAGLRGAIYSGAVRIGIDETGRVISANLLKSVHPAYDPLVLAAARNWRYRPATVDGVPVASEKTVEIQLRP